jgi:hypothetical protein
MVRRGQIQEVSIITFRPLFNPFSHFDARSSFHTYVCWLPLPVPLIFDSGSRYEEKYTINPWWQSSSLVLPHSHSWFWSKIWTCGKRRWVDRPVNVESTACKKARWRAGGCMKLFSSVANRTSIQYARHCESLLNWYMQTCQPLVGFLHPSPCSFKHDKRWTSSHSHTYFVASTTSYSLIRWSGHCISIARFSLDIRKWLSEPDPKTI